MMRFMDGTEGKCVGIAVADDIAAEDFTALADLLREKINEHGDLRLLIHLESLGRIEPLAFWEDLKFSVEHVKDVKRIALVGDSAWQGPYTKIMGAIIPGDMRHFENTELDEAWAWLKA